MKNVNTQAKLAKDLRVGDTFEVVLFRRKLIAVVKKIDSWEPVKFYFGGLSAHVLVEFFEEIHPPSARGMLFTASMWMTISQSDSVTGELISMHALSVKIEWPNEYHEAR